MVSAFCETTTRQAEAEAVKVEISSRAMTGALSGDLQVRLDKGEALVKEAWDLRNRGDQAAALAKTQRALALLPQQESPQASQIPSQWYSS